MVYERPQKNTQTKNRLAKRASLFTERQRGFSAEIRSAANSAHVSVVFFLFPTNNHPIETLLRESGVEIQFPLSPSVGIFCLTNHRPHGVPQQNRLLKRFKEMSHQCSIIVNPLAVFIFRGTVLSCIPFGCRENATVCGFIHIFQKHLNDVVPCSSIIL